LKEHVFVFLCFHDTPNFVNWKYANFGVVSPSRKVYIYHSLQLTV